jgi:hypothetical protein
MANENTKAHVLVRDCFTCRYCGARLYLPQAIKVFDMYDPSKGKHWHPSTKLEPLRSSGATVDHIIPEDAPKGYDTFDNLVACCVICNSRKGKGQLDLLPPSSDKSWDGGSGLFLTLAPRYKMHLNKVDVKWLKALSWEGITPKDENNIRAQIDRLPFYSELFENLPK